MPADTDLAVQTVLCIPGPWRDRSELLERVARDSDGYLFAGGVIMHMESKAMFELEVHEADPRMARAFAAAGWHWKDTPEMARIAEHSMVLYLVGEGGSHDAAVAIMQAAAGLIKAGGFGVKVESTGLAHTPASWLKMAEEHYLFSAYRAYVVTLTGDDTHSCGMHNLGLPDTIVDAHGIDNPADLVSTFNWYQYSEAPTIQAGQTFSTAEGEPRYRISHEPCDLYEEDSLFTNPFGLWRLVPV